MSGWLKSGPGNSSPLEDPKPAATSPGQTPGGKRTSGLLSKATKEKQRIKASKSSIQQDASQQREGVDPRADTEAPHSLSNYREQLRKQMNSRGYQQPPASPKRPSPIPEESSNSPGIGTAAGAGAGVRTSESMTTTSTESSATIRGMSTPNLTARTPSYPFPRMTTPGRVPSHLHRPFTSLSPTSSPEQSHGARSEPLGLLDKVLSNPSTPASTLTFQPAGVSHALSEPGEFPSPNLYDLSLMLSAEPGLDAWWNAVVQIMREAYKAERVTLAVPADTTDIENVPWGQKATYDARGEDDLSLGYMARGSSMIPSSTDGRSETTSQNADPYGMLSPLRPNLPSRHSFSSYETRQEKGRAAMETTLSGLRRPAQIVRSLSSYPTPTAENFPENLGTDHSLLNKKALEEHDAVEATENMPSWEESRGPQRENQGRVLPMLQALDYEADPLIDHNGISRVLERGKAIALTRSYPYLEKQAAERSEEVKGKARSRSSEGLRKQQPQQPQQPQQQQQQQVKRPRPDSFPKLSSLLGGSHLYKGGKGQYGEKRRTFGSPSRYEDDMPRPPTPKYEEYEQAPPSPWSQSPAPSPAIRADVGENPFFTDAVVDEDSFNPSSPPVQDYSTLKALQTIGVDNSWTVLHVPLSHVLLSRPTPTFKLDATTMERKTHLRSKSNAKEQEAAATIQSPGSVQREKHCPIAVLSILSPLIPYPSNLRHSLEYLAPHLATSFSLCRHYTNLETEIAGLQRRRVQTGGLVSGQMNLENLGYLPRETQDAQMSLGGGSITSPSDYSLPSRSATGSATGTPNWDHNSFGMAMEKRQMATSPLLTTTAGGDSYFSVNPSSSSMTKPSTPGGGQAQQLRDRRGSKESIAAEKRSSSRRFSFTKHQHEPSPPSPGYDSRANESATETPTKGTATISVPVSASAEDPIPWITAERTERNEKSDKSGDSIHDAQGAQGIQGTQGTQGTQGGGGHRKVMSSSNKGVHRHTHLHSHGADFSTTFQSLPPSSTIASAGRSQQTPSRSGSGSVPRELLPPSDTLKGLILDSLPAHIFIAVPPIGDMVWVNSRYLSYRGVTAAQLAADPYGSIHPLERDEYIRAWVHSLRTGDPFSRTVRIRRFDGAYRWFQARAIATRDKRNLVQQFLGSYMDIHDQHTAELKAARQEEIEASEAKHRLLANLIPQIIFTATEDEGITFANEQWLSYTGQSFEDSLGLGFMNFVHPDDLAKCRIPTGTTPGLQNPGSGDRDPAGSASASAPVSTTQVLGLKSTLLAVTTPKLLPTPNISQGVLEAMSRRGSSSSGSDGEGRAGDLVKLAKKGVIKISTDSNGRLSYTTEVRLRSKTGDYRWHLIRCVEIDNIDFGSGASSYFGSATDINDHKLLEAKLKEAMESKSRFLSNMSHEIRTPLIGISGMVSFLQDTTLNEEQQDYTNTIQTSANSLIMIINDILDLSKVDAGMMKLNYEWFHTPSLIEAVNELVSTMAIAKRLELNYIVEPDVPAWVKGDKVRIRQVLLNVIGNAIKFTSEGEVFSRCRVVTRKNRPSSQSAPSSPTSAAAAAADSAAGSAADPAVEHGDNEIVLEFSVVDTGRGFTKEESELIFKPFSQIDGSSTRQHGGSGLGLVISRQLVELHGGKMDGTAVPGKGSTFTFTAKFGLPHKGDREDLMISSNSPQDTSSTSTATPGMAEGLQVARLFKASTMQRMRQESPPVVSPRTVEPGHFSPAMASSGSSDPSVRSSHTIPTQRSSMSSINAGLVHFSEAARASGQDLSQMKLEMPSESEDRGRDIAKHNEEEKSSSSTTLTPNDAGASLKPPATTTALAALFRPLLYSILIISPQMHSREATTKHIEMTLPKDVPHQITALATVAQAQKLIGGDDPVLFTHIVVNLPTAEELMGLMDELARSGLYSRASVLILSDSVQRQALLKTVAGTRHEELLSDSRVTYIYKPVKPSRFAAVFDPSQERDLSVDRNRSTAQQMVESQKQSYIEVARRMGGKGHRVLLVEDNPINQKVLLKYLRKVGVEVDVALDGQECTDMVFSMPRSHYSLILCDLHMPQKDGYQACREVREWERRDGGGGLGGRLPIIALSANVMSDVQEKCLQAGFDAYVTKPVDFIDLSDTLSHFF